MNEDRRPEGTFKLSWTYVMATAKEALGDLVRPLRDMTRYAERVTRPKSRAISTTTYRDRPAR